MTRSSPTSASARPRRQPVGSRERLRVRVPKEDGYVYRLVNASADSGGRVENLLDQGYEIVPEVKRENDRRVDNASPLGAAAGINLGRGDKGILMRQRKEYWDEDQVLKHAKQDNLEQTMKDAVRQASDYGKFTVEIEK